MRNKRALRLFLAKPRGFCAGVERAIQQAESSLEKWGAPLYALHEIVHNHEVIHSLEKKGVRFVQKIEEVPEKAPVLYSAHGISPKTRLLAKQKALIEIDATCSVVARIHRMAREFAAKGYKILLIGHKDHVEVLGIYGEAPTSVTVLASLGEIEILDFPPSQKLLLLVQTTFDREKAEKLKKSLKKRFSQLETPEGTSMVCYATFHRQRAFRKIFEKGLSSEEKSSKVDLALIVGDRTSSNSNRLKEIAEGYKIPSYLIHNAEEIDFKWFEEVSAIAMTAGASTPERIVQSTLQRLSEFGVLNVEEVSY